MYIDSFSLEVKCDYVTLFLSPYVHGSIFLILLVGIVEGSSRVAISNLAKYALVLKSGNYSFCLNVCCHVLILPLADSLHQNSPYQRNSSQQQIAWPNLTYE